MGRRREGRRCVVGQLRERESKRDRKRVRRNPKILYIYVCSQLGFLG